MFADLSKKINATHLNPDMLVGKYIPNLIAKPFQVSREYAQIIYDQTSSPHFNKVLKKWEEDKWASGENRQQLAYIILVELLAYQFALPVRWIETQDLLFTSFNFKRLIELGPSSTLTGMATCTLKAKYETLDGSVSRTRAILCHSKNIKEIYYQYEDETKAPPAESASDAAAAPSAPAAAAAAPTTPVAVAAPSGPVASIEDVPMKAIDILLVIIAQRRIDRRSLFRKPSKIWLAENRRCRMKSSITHDNSADFKVIKLSDSFKASMFFLTPISTSTSWSLNPLALSDLSHLRGLLDLEKVDLEKVIVITGFGEVRPWGSSHTRWEMEARSESTIEGCIEMAWLMGFIKCFDGHLKHGLFGSTVRQMNPSMTRMSKAITRRRFSCTLVFI